jgi:MscS family membrane protein
MSHDRSMARWLVPLLLALSPGALASPEEGTTPRSAVQSFLDATTAHRWEEAARLLSPQVEQPPETIEKLAGTARELKAVLEIHLADELERMSDSPEGKLDDKLPGDTEEVGIIPNPSGRGTDSVRLLRSPDGQWRFSPMTVSRVPSWYAALPDRWLREHLPEVLLRAGPRGLFYWQYLALMIVAVAGYLFGRLLAAALLWLFQRLASRTETTFDDDLVRLMHRPLRLFMITVVAQWMLGSVLLTKSSSDFVLALLGGLRLISIYWGLIKAVELASETAKQSAFLAERPETRALLPLGSRAAKIALTVLAIVVFLQKLGYPAASLIAGLGIGGLAFALAAQKTVENLFGSVMLTLDQPFRPGDLVQIEGLTGTVEHVGLRSTRIRTPDRSVVTIPNGRLADLRIESLAQRDRMRLYVVLSLTQATGSAALGGILTDIREWLEKHPNRSSDPQRVAVTALGQGSIDIEVAGFFDITDPAAFVPVKQEALLMMLQVIERHGSALALPGRTLHLASVPQQLLTGGRGSGDGP